MWDNGGLPGRPFAGRFLPDPLSDHKVRKVRRLCPVGTMASGDIASMNADNPMVPLPNIRYVGIGQLTIYLVSEEELRMIESGGPSATYLNLAIGFLSVGSGIGASLLLSGTPASIYRFVVVIVAAIGSLIAGFVLLVLWLRSSKDASNTIKRIRSRGASVGAIVEGTVVEGSE